MNARYIELYDQMVREIKRILALDLPEIENVTACFWIACNFWEKLKTSLKPTGFHNESEEVIFFREVKPAFTAYAEYFTLVSEALTCVPKEPRMIRLYWGEEAERFRRFCGRYEDFIKYYESGARYSDSQFYLRSCRNKTGYQFPRNSFHGSDIQTAWILFRRG